MKMALYQGFKEVWLNLDIRKVQALDEVIRFCQGVINRGKKERDTAADAPSDDEIEICEHILRIIQHELKK